MRLSVRLSVSLVVAVALVSLAFALYQTQSERYGLRRDLERQALELAQSLEKSIAPLVESGTNGSKRDLQKLIDRFRGQQRLAGIAVYDPQEEVIAISSALASKLAMPPASVMTALQGGNDASEFFDSMHVVVLPIRDQASAIAGALAVFHDASYIGSQTAAVWRGAWASVVIQTVLIVGVTLLVLRWGLQLPLAGLTVWLRDMRTGSASQKAVDLPKEDLFQPFHREAIRLATTLNEARAAAEEEARLRDAGESLWTPERLRISVQTKLNGSRLFALSNREPYEHKYRGNAIEWSVPASGLVTALEPVLRACEGTWIAQGTGEADRAAVDEFDRLGVPPDHPQYTLRRVWLTPEEEEGFYFGFANEGLWPLCHIAHTRPIFREQDWREYEKVNRRFADALLQEAEGEEYPLVLVQDYHFALVPAMIKEARPDARVAIFWHIPWPNPEAFAICPWQRPLLSGLLGADLIGFHLQSHCNNFLDTVDKTLESRVDRERFGVDRRGHHTSVRPFPISVPFPSDGDTAPERSSYEERAELLRKLGIKASMMGIGVDRVDYTKGLPERFLALEEFFERYPAYRGQFTFVQVGAPSRTRIPRYQELMTQLLGEVDRINRRFQTNEWKPIVFLAQHHSHDEILPYYRAADVCLVTSLHDGMNLVAKEYLAAQTSEQGALVLSRFAGAAHELSDALQVNPYDIGETANAIHRALELSPEERRARLARMRTYIREHNIYRWAGSLITELAAVRLPPRESPPEEADQEPAQFAAVR